MKFIDADVFDAMPRFMVGILGLMLIAPSNPGLCQGQIESGSPSEQYQALRKAYDRAASSGVPLSDAERLKFIGQSYKNRYAFAHRFVELAEKYPREPVAVEALIQAVW